MEQPPRTFLRIVLIEMGEEGSVRQVLEARGIVPHSVGGPRQVGGDVAIAVLALVGALDVAEARAGPGLRHGSLGEAGDRGRVIYTRAEGGVAHREVVGHHVQVRDRSGLLEVAVGDRPRRILPGHQPTLDFVAEGRAPDVRLAGGVEEDAPHSLPGGVRCPQVSGFLRDDLGQVRRAILEAGAQPLEGGEVMADFRGDADAVSFCGGERPLQGAEETFGPRDGVGHEAQKAEVTFPLLGADAAGGPKPVKECAEGERTVVGELQRLPVEVHDPAQYLLTGSEAPVAFPQLLERHCFIAVRLIRPRLGQEAVDGVKEVPSEPAEPLATPLPYQEEVVHEDVDVPEGTGERAVGRRGSFLRLARNQGALSWARIRFARVAHAASRRGTNGRPAGDGFQACVPLLRIG